MGPSEQDQMKCFILWLNKPTFQRGQPGLTHWGRVTHICISKLIVIVSDNGLSPGWRQAIIWTNAGLLLIGHLGTKFNEILIEIHTLSFKKMQLKSSSAKRQPFCLGLNVLMDYITDLSVRLKYLHANLLQILQSCIKSLISILV